ncbi:epithelial-stromal interaction protein 1 isoform X2 [Sphaeramia orbicularis]|uniref:epithelial-stromal interaction protein 1 isoform X2 n=1 Tax=Sphaeramia orbicularis TaxID=375764 RepID=UPI001180FC6F|nr:epithelial-stromal interaction protein 1-like isoform X2 [Sphaeramia orbicularis]
MAATKVLKPKPPTEAPRRLADRLHPVSGPRVRAANGPGTEPRGAAQSRGSSCPRCPRGERREAATGAQGAAASSGTRARSSSAAPKCPRPPLPEHRRPARPVRQTGADTRKEPRGVKGEAGSTSQRAASQRATSHSHKAFTVIPPNPKKRQEIQRKAEAELAALEELRLSRAMAYVSINPSSVGGCLSLEEVRLKQQQEMIQAKRKPKQVRRTPSRLHSHAAESRSDGRSCGRFR